MIEFTNDKTLWFNYNIFQGELDLINKDCTEERDLIKNFKRLSPSVRKRLTLENDDKASMYSVKDLMYIHKHTGIPIVFD